MSYPRNAATPKAVAIGPLVKVADGTLLAVTTGVNVRVDLDGGGWGAGGGTIAVDATSSIFTYAPTQAETNGDVLKIALYIAGYVSISQTVTMDPLDLAVDVTKWANETIPGTDQTGVPIVDVGYIRSFEVTCNAGVTILPKLGFDGVPGAEDGPPILNVAGSIVGSLTGNVSAVVGNVGGKVLGDGADPILGVGVQAEVPKLLKYVQLLARSDAAITTDNATELVEINANGGSGAGDFAATSDSQEALRDDLAKPGDEMDFVDAPNETAVAALKANVADVAAVAEVAAVAPTAEVAAVAPTADVAPVAAVAETAPTAAVAEVAAVAPTAEVAAVAPTAEVAAVAEVAPTAAVAEVAAVAPTAEVAATAPTAAVAAVAAVAEVASVAPTAEVAAVADPTDPALIAAAMVGVPLTISLPDATGALPAGAFANQPAATLTFGTTEKQAVRDSMKLAPTAGAPDAGSVDAELDTLISNTSALSGSGAYTITVTVTDDATPAAAVEGAIVRYSKTGETWTATTNASGVATFNVDAATWTVAATAAGLSYAGSSHVVSGDGTKSIVMTTVSIPAPSDEDLCVCYGVTRTEAGIRQGGVALTIELVTPASPAGQYRRTPISVTSDSNGDWQKELGPGAYRVQRAGGPNYPTGWTRVTVPDAASYEFPVV